jgi:hypothetical protein
VDLEALQLIRAEEQMRETGCWRYADPAEKGGNRRHCLACDRVITDRRTHVKLCPACRAAGIRSHPCSRCGGLTHKRDWAGRKLNGVCTDCRRSIREGEAT